MLEKIALMDSAVIKALLGAFFGVLGLVASIFFGVDEAAFGAKAGRLVDGLLLLWTAGTLAYAAYSRATKPTPPLTQMAVDATVQDVTSGKLSTTPTPPRQGGFLRPGMLGAIIVAAALGSLLAACTGTKAAYEAARTRPETALPDTAYVVAEQYRAVLKEAADLKQSGRLPAELVERLQGADRALKPLVIGDPTATPPKAGLRQLAESFQAVRNAQTEADLQRAVDEAVLQLAEFIRALEQARRFQ